MKKYKKLKIFAIIVALILVFMLVINIVPPKHNVADNPFVVGEDGLPMIAAHRGAPTGTARQFVLTQFLGVNLFDNSDFACLQIPTSYDVGIEIDLDKKTLIQRAHRRNIAVQYWTINDADEMRELIELGCDCIMTDNPELLKSVLAEYQ